jgi:hypothetical protein
MAYLGLSDEALLVAAEKAEQRARRLRVEAFAWEEESGLYRLELERRREAAESGESDSP